MQQPADKLCLHKLVSVFLYQSVSFVCMKFKKQKHKPRQRISHSLCYILLDVYNICVSLIFFLLQKEKTIWSWPAHWETFLSNVIFFQRKVTNNVVLAGPLGDGHLDLHRAHLQLCHENEHFHCHTQGCCLKLIRILAPF